jgi:hypothetical protein
MKEIRMKYLIAHIYQNVFWGMESEVYLFIHDTI